MSPSRPLGGCGAGVGISQNSLVSVSVVVMSRVSPFFLGTTRAHGFSGLLGQISLGRWFFVILGSSSGYNECFFVKRKDSDIEVNRSLVLKYAE